jgi:polyisoprenoid-binding protein YceI
MRKLIFTFLVVSALSASAFVLVTAERMEINTGYQVNFSGRYDDGSFGEMKGTILFDKENPAASKFEISIAVASINTGNFVKNWHAKGDKWFDAEKYPTIHFVSTHTIKTAAGYQVSGSLQMHGVAKPLTIPFTYDNSGKGGIFKGTFKVNRPAYGIGSSKGDESDFTTLQVSVPVTVKN